MISLDSFVSPTLRFEEASDVETSVFHELSLPSSPGPRSHYSDTSPCSTPVNQAHFDLVFLQHHSSAPVTSNLLLNSNTPDVAFTLDLTQDRIPWIFPGLDHNLGLIFDGDPVTINVPQSNEIVPWFSEPPSFDPLDANPQPSSFGQDVEDSSQIAAGPYAPPLVDIPLPGWDICQPEALVSYENSLTPDFVDPVASIHVSSYPWENIQVADIDAVHSLSCTSPPFEQQLIRSGVYLRPCEWKDGDRTVCRELITRASVPEHLIKHGIENLPRDHLMTCRWVGCKRKKPMNRESIVRHIREAHLRLRRSSSKGVQHPYL